MEAGQQVGLRRGREGQISNIGKFRVEKKLVGFIFSFFN